MNTNQVLATISKTSPRAADWRGVFGRLDNIPLQGPLPIVCKLPGKGESACYMLDLQAITPEERERLIDYIAIRFGSSRKVVEDSLDDVGMPIVADDVLVSIPQGLALSMMLDFDTERQEDDWLESSSMSEWDYEEEDDDDF